MSNKLDRPFATLFLIESLDGKISTGDNNGMDVDKDYQKIVGIREGVQQYYDIEKRTDIVSFNTAVVMEKIGVNKRDLSKIQKEKSLCFIVVDNKPHLDVIGATYFALRSKIFYLITTNKNHPAFALKDKYPNIEIIFYEKSIDFIDLFKKFKSEYGIKRVTVQSGGTLNTLLVRLGLIDMVSIVIAPCLIGGKGTPSLMDGESLHTEEELSNIKALELVFCKKLKHNFLHLKYKVINKTVVL